MYHQAESPPRWRVALYMLLMGPIACLIGLCAFGVGLAALPSDWTGWALLAGLVCATAGAVGMHRSFPSLDITVEQRLKRTVQGTATVQRARPFVLLAFLVLIPVVLVGGENAIWVPIGAYGAGGFAAFFVDVLRVRRFRGPEVWDDMARVRKFYGQLGRSRGRRGRLR